MNTFESIIVVYVYLKKISINIIKTSVFLFTDVVNATYKHVVRSCNDPVLPSEDADTSDGDCAYFESFNELLILNIPHMNIAIV